MTFKNIERYCSIHTHTNNQPDGVQTLDELIQFGVDTKRPALAVTDHGNMSGLLSFYYKAKAANIKPILGTEIYYCKDVNDKYSILELPNGKTKKKPHRLFHLVLLAKNLSGYHNLVKMMNEAQKHFYGKARVDTAMLRKYCSDGNIICSTACMNSPLSTDINHTYELYNIFKDNLYLELQYHGYNPEKEKAFADSLISVARREKIKLIITNDAHISKKEDLVLHQILTAADRGLSANSDEAKFMQGDGYHNLTGEELWPIASNIIDREVFQECINNVSSVIDQCDVQLPYKKGQFHFPEFETPAGFENNFEYLKSLCYNSDRFNPDTHSDRLKYELKVYKDCGFVDYILPLDDIIRFCKINDIEVGVARGSAGGSLLNYLLYITQIDPVLYDLSFERFITVKYDEATDTYINARQSAPDIDLDFEDNNKVFEYVRRKYGKDRVCGIGTQLIYGPKSALREVLRVYDFMPTHTDMYAKMIPDTIQSFSEILCLDTLPGKLDDIREYVKLAYRLEGRISTTSTHAAGVVFSNQLQEHIPLVIDKKQVSGKQDEEEVDSEDLVKYVSQYDMDSIKNTGFTKYDFLGLSTLKVLKLCEKWTGIKWKEINPLAEENEVIYREIFAKGKTVGIFQFASHGMQGLLKDIYANCLDDVIACNALYRPQTLVQGLHKEYVENKLNTWKGFKDINGDRHEIIDSILKSTHGIPVYQEQVLALLTKLGKIPAFDADTFRKILADNKTNTDPEQLKKLQNYRDQFLKGAVENDLPLETAVQLYNDLSSKSGYSFNKSHSTAYSITAFCLAYYKYHFPLKFIVATLNDSPDDFLGLIKEHDKKIRIKMPDINKSQLHPSVEVDEQGEYVQFGLMNILGLGEESAKAIISSRPYDLSTINIKQYLEELRYMKTDEYAQIKESNRKTAKADKVKLPKAEKSLLGDLSKVEGRKLTSKVIELLTEVGAFISIYPDEPITVDNQLKHFGFVLDMPTEVAEEFMFWHNYEDKYEGDTAILSGYILESKDKMTKTEKPFIACKVYNPIINTSYDVKVWENSFVTPLKKYGKETQLRWGYKSKGFKKGDAVIFKVRKGSGGMVTYQSGYLWEEARKARK